MEESQMTLDQMLQDILNIFNENLYDREKNIQNYTKLVALQQIKAENDGKTDIEVDDKTVEERTNALSANKYFKSHIEKTTSDKMRTYANGGNAPYDVWKSFEHKERLKNDPLYKEELEDKAKLQAAKSRLEDEQKFSKLNQREKVDALKDYLNYSLPRNQRAQFRSNLENHGSVLLNELVQTSESAKECLDVINNEKDVNVQNVLFGGIKEDVRALNSHEAMVAEEAFAEDRDKVVENRKIQRTETNELRAKRDSLYDKIENSDLYRATVMSKAEQAKQMLKQLDEIDKHKAQTRDKGKENSQSYNDMRQSLEAVAAFADMDPSKITKDKVDKAFEGLKNSGKTYEKEHTGISNLFRNNYGYGAERLAFSRGLEGFVNEAVGDINNYNLLNAGIQQGYEEAAEKYNSEIKSRNKASFDNAVKNNSGNVKLEDIVGKKIADKISSIENNLKDSGMTLKEVIEKMEAPKSKEQFAEELKQSRKEHLNKITEKFDPEKNTGKIDLNLIDDADNIYEDNTIDMKAEQLAKKEQANFENAVGEDNLRDIKALKGEIERLGLDIKSVIEFKETLHQPEKAPELNEEFIKDIKDAVNNAAKESKRGHQNEPKPAEPKNVAPKKDEEELFMQASDETVDKRVEKFEEKSKSTHGTVSFANEEAANQLYIIRGQVESNALSEKDLRYALATVMLGDFSNSATGKNMLDGLDDQVKNLDDYRKFAEGVAESESFKKALPDKLDGKYLNSFLVDGKAGALLGSRFSMEVSKQSKENQKNLADEAAKEFAKNKAIQQKNERQKNELKPKQNIMG